MSLIVMAVNINSVAKLYKEAYARFGRSQAAVLCPKGRQHLRFAALLSGFDVTERTLLDFGCGLGHLAEYLRSENVNCRYVGVDIVNEFIEDNHLAMPDQTFHHISDIGCIKDRYNFVIASGVFNLRYHEDYELNREYVFDQIEKLWLLATDGLAIDFLSDKVDFQVPGAFHISASEVLRFAFGRLSRRVQINHNYLPFEFCLSARKDESIDRSAGLYYVD